MTMASPMEVHQNYHPDCEAAINRQVNMELHASYVHLSMAYYFVRDDVSLRHFAEHFLRLSHEEMGHAHKLMRLQKERGGHILLHDIEKSERDDWESSLQALEYAFHLEQSVNQALLELHHLATDKSDAHLCDFLEAHPLNEQVKSIEELGDYGTNLRRMGAPDDGMVEYLFDKLTLGHSDKEN